MSFSREWEAIYKAGEHNSVWPWSDLVSLTYRYMRGADLSKKKRRVLELGCGAGANIPFFLSLGMDYYAIEGSAYQTEILNNRFSDKNVQIIESDFTKEIPFESSFDLIVDRGSVTCNSTNDIRKTLELVYKKLVRGGIFIGIDWFSDTHSDFTQRDAETEFIDEDTCIFHTGYFSGLGAIHFFYEGQIRDMLKRFLIRELSEKKVVQCIPQKNIWATWNLVAQKESK